MTTSRLYRILGTSKNLQITRNSVLRIEDTDGEVHLLELTPGEEEKLLRQKLKRKLSELLGAHIKVSIEDNKPKLVLEREKNSKSGPSVQNSRSFETFDFQEGPIGSDKSYLEGRFESYRGPRITLIGQVYRMYLQDAKSMELSPLSSRDLVTRIESNIPQDYDAGANQKGKWLNFQFDDSRLKYWVNLNNGVITSISLRRLSPTD